MAVTKKTSEVKVPAAKTPAKKAGEKKTDAQVSVQTVAKKSPAKKAVAKPVGAKVAVKKVEPNHQQIAELAHTFWLERGGRHGDDAQDWLRAERQLRG